MGLVEQTIRQSIRTPATLHTISQGSPFVLSEVGSRGLLLLLGDTQSPVRLSWRCMEGIPDYIRRHGGTVVSGARRSNDSLPGTLDAYLKGFTKTHTANYVSVVLATAGIVDADAGPPLTITLRQ